jgi:single-stranded DNA-binding protein
MSAFAIVTGAVYRAPEQRTSKAGKPFVTATIRAKEGETTLWWKVVAFSDSAQAELMRLGDSLSVQGAFKAELYQPEGGEPKVSLSIIADRVLALRQSPASRSAKERKAPKDRDAPYRGGAAWAFDDSIPFGYPTGGRP